MDLSYLKYIFEDKIKDMDKPIHFFFATNTPPPQWFLNPDDTIINSGESVRNKLSELKELNMILFAWVEEENEFIPLHKDNAHLKIQDFKFIIRTMEGYKEYANS